MLQAREADFDPVDCMESVKEDWTADSAGRYRGRTGLGGGASECHK